MKYLFSGIFTSIFLISGTAHAVDFLKPVTCKHDVTDEQVKISADGRVERTQNGKASSISFQSCRFELSGPVSSQDKRADYTCETPGLASRYRLEETNSGYYNLSQEIRLNGRWTLNDSMETAAKIKRLEQRVGTFKCDDPNMAAYIDAQNKARGGSAPAKAPVRK